MTDILLSEQTNDLRIESGELILSTTTIESLRQRIYITLNAWLGEWKLNINFGIPFRQSIFVKGVTKGGVDAIFRAQIAAFSDIIEVEEFTSELDTRTRQYSITRLIVRTSEGTQVLVNRFMPDVNTTYQSTPISATGNICSEISPALANEFHEWLHFDLVGLWG